MIRYDENGVMIPYEIEGGKGGESKPHTPVETPNNLLSVAYAKVLLAIAEGELAGQPTAKDIYLDGTPLQNEDGSYNFGGVKWEWRSGSQDQEAIEEFPEVSSEYSVGIELKDNVQWTRAVTKSQLTDLRVTFSWPALLRQSSNGDTNGYKMQYAIDLSTDGGAFQEYQVYTIDGKTNTNYERTHKVKLPKPGSNWTVRARRVTPENNSSTIQDTINVKSYAEVVAVKQRYPNTALLYVEFDSRLFGAGNIPKISVRTKGRVIQVPTNYDPVARTYSGIWDGSFKWAWTNNPAWVFYDLLTQDRFGLGHKVVPAMVDKFALYEIAQYCDVMVDDGTGSGTMEPRHTCNIFIQDKAGAWKVLRDIAGIFNGMTYWDGNKFVAVADKWEPITNAPLFSRSNVVNGNFDYQAADDKSIYTSALVSYDDPDNHYNTDVEPTFETSQILRWGGDRQTEITAIGCTSRGEAQRKGKYTLITNLYNRTVSFQTGLQGLSADVLPGKLIHVLDPILGGRPYTGRIKASAGKVITLDRDVTAVAGDILYLTMDDGSSEGRTVVSSTGNIVTVSVDYGKPIPSNSVWYLEASDLKSQLFRVTKVTNPSANVYEIEGVEYNESKFDAIDNGARLEPRPVSVVPPGQQQAPTNLVVSSSTYIEQTMAVTSLVATWDQMPNAVQYEVHWRYNDGDWISAGITGSPTITIKGIYTGDYVVRVRAINAVGVKSVWTNSVSTRLDGKTGGVPALAYLTTTPIVYGIRLNWGFPDGAGDTARTEIMHSANPNFADAIKLGDYSYPTDMHEMHGLKAGQQFWFWGRLVDRTGNIGPWKPLESEAGVPGTSSVDQSEYEEYFKEQITESSLYKELNDRIDLIDGFGPGSVNERVETVNDRVDEANLRIDQTNTDLDNAVADLESQIANITDAMVYDPTKTYVTGDIVRVGNKLYQAQQDVPINTSPPNLTYWEDVGSILEDANAVVTQVDINTQKIAEVDGKITATGEQINSLQAMWRDDDGEGSLNDAIDGWSTAAKYAQEVKVRANEDEALAQRLTTLSATVDTNKASISTLEVAFADTKSASASRMDSIQSQVNSNSASVYELTKTVASESQVTTEKINTMQSSIDGNTSKITSLETTVTTLESTTASALDLVNSRVDDTQASVGTEATTRASADEALSLRVDTTESSIADNTASIQQVEEAQTSLTESVTRLSTNVSSSWSGLRDDDDDGSLQDALGNWQTAANYGLEVRTRTDADTAMTTRIETLTAALGVNTAAISNEASVRASADAALSTSISNVQATTNSNTAAIQTVSSAQTSTDGKLNAMWAVKAQVTSQGQYVAAGFGLGIENGPAGLQSQFLVQADKFAVVNGTNATLTAPFVVTGGQVFMNEALITKAMITNAIIGSTITASAQTNWGGSIMTIDFTNGSVTTRHPTMANTYTVMDRAGVRVYVSNILRVRMGTW